MCVTLTVCVSKALLSILSVCWLFFSRVFGFSFYLEEEQMQGLFRVHKEMKQAVSLTRFFFYWLQIHTNGKFLQMYFRKFVHFLFILVISALPILPFSRDCKYFISFNLQNSDSIDNRFSILSFNVFWIIWKPFLLEKMFAYLKFNMKFLVNLSGFIYLSGKHTHQKFYTNP